LIKWWEALLQSLHSLEVLGSGQVPPILGVLINIRDCFVEDLLLQILSWKLLNIMILKDGRAFILNWSLHVIDGRVHKWLPPIRVEELI